MSFIKQISWVISYDNCNTFTPILDSEGNSVLAVGKDGEQGPQGNSVRVVSNDQSYYVIEIYNSATGEVIDTIVTKYSSNLCFVGYFKYIKLLACISTLASSFYILNITQL